MDTIILRKMTLDSKFNSGKYEGATVRHVIEMNNKDYLRWVYYNQSKITFTDDILETIGIIDMQIDKPGKSEISYLYVRNYFWQQLSFNYKSHIKAHQRKKSKGKISHYNALTENRKCNLQAKNHGKF